MKSKTLALITAALITAAALALTASLSLLDSSAIDDPFEESLAENGSIGSIETPVVEDAPITEDEPVVEDTPAVEDEPVVDDEPVIDDEPIVEDAPAVDEAPKFPIGPLGNPVFPASPEYDGSEIVEGHSAPCYIDDVVVAIYEHATGELVGQVTFRDDQVWRDVEELHRGVYTLGNCVYNSNDKDAVPIAIPNGKYRVEVYAIWWADDGGCGTLFFAYTYGTNELLEMWKCGTLYSGGHEFIAYIDALIADEMAAIEAGTNTVPALEETVTYICGFGAEKVSFSAFEWTGDFHKTFESMRGTPRFPYLETEE
ncbi:MAG: hypothetical protein IKM32_00320 [Clostridia bacterium]|nr:hypothetical protein [Clostridia bacterium]